MADPVTPEPAAPPELVMEAYGTVTLPPGWHYDNDGNPTKDKDD
jgi:LDH2 family malate/lactate/ureidoglycolate dehydrogenase